jgi:uncharacterized protein YjbI with pentapeptide repeats
MFSAMAGASILVNWARTKKSSWLRVSGLKADGTIDARGQRITSARLEQILDAVQRPDGRPVMLRARFERATFTGDADFRNAIFNDATFRGATFEGRASFQNTIFRGKADFQDTQWKGEARFDANFGEVILDHAVFDRRVRLVVRAKYLSAVRVEFRAEKEILAQSAAITLEDATFAAPSTLGPATGEDTSVTSTIPQVVSLRGARVVDLALSGVDLRACHFRGSYGLASVRLEQVLLAEPPEGWTKARRWSLPIRWTRRVAIAEEHQWRAAKGFDGWETPDWPCSREHEPPTPAPTPHQIAAIYRALRSGVEARKDAPGAADFYYGEMEMRRHSKYEDAEDDQALRSKPPYRAPTLEAWANYDNTRRTPRAEKFVLWLYWLVSGYGLRASRALLALLLTVVIFTAVLYVFGLKDRDLSVALLQSIQGAAFAAFRGGNQKLLSEAGQYLQIPLRLLGPFFLGLALFSLRGRVKR